MIEGVEGIGELFGFYNQDRPHQGLGNRTPAEVYAGGAADRRTQLVLSR